MAGSGDAPDEEGKPVVLRDEGRLSSVDAESGLAHSLATTAANAADVTQACVLLHGDETEAWGDGATRVWTSAGEQGLRPPGRWR